MAGISTTKSRNQRLVLPCSFSHARGGSRTGTAPQAFTGRGGCAAGFAVCGIGTGAAAAGAAAVLMAGKRDFASTNEVYDHIEELKSLLRSDCVLSPLEWNLSNSE